MGRRPLILTLVPLIGLVGAQALPGPAAAGWTAYPVGQGPPSSTITCSALDSTGGLWFGTDRGLARYDGSSWRVFTTEQGLPGDGILALHVEPSGLLWVGTGSGAGRWDGHSWQQVGDARGPGSRAVNAIAVDPDARTWFGTEDGLFRRDSAGWTVFRAAANSHDPVLGSDLWDSRIKSLLVDTHGDLWVGTAYGFNIFYRDGWITRKDASCFLHEVAGPGVVSLLQYRRPAIHRIPERGPRILDGSIWFGTDGGVAILFDGKLCMLRAAVPGTGGGADFPLRSNDIQVLYQDSRGAAWIGAGSRFPEEGALTRFDGGEWRSFGAREGLTATAITTIVEDASGHLWFGTLSNGLLRFDGELWTTVTSDDSLSVSRATCLALGPGDDLWVGGAAGADRWDETRWHALGAAQGILAPRVQAIVIAPDSTAWLGTAGSGLYGLRPDGELVQVTSAQGLAGENVLSLHQASGETLWAGTNLGLTQVIEGLPVRTFTTVDGLPSQVVRAVVEDSSGVLWCATDRGLARRSGLGFVAVTTAHGLVADDVRDLVVSRDGALWCATWGGAARLRDGQWTGWTDAGGFPLDRLTAVAEDSAGMIWFGTDNAGAIRYDGRSFRSFQVADGLPGTRIVDILVDRRGRTWFAGDDAGVTRHEPDGGAPRAVIRTSQAGLGSSRTVRATLDHAYEERSPVEFSTSTDNGAWSAWSGDDNWEYPDAPDGEHTLAVLARDGEGNVDGRPARVTFEVDATPPQPVLRSPVFGQVLRGAVEIEGTAADLRFAGFRVEFRPAGLGSWQLLRASSEPDPGGTLATWETGAHPDGRYELRLSVTDSLGLTGIARIDVDIDNMFPDAAVTAPTTVTAASGGDVYTVDGAVRLSFPPRALGRDSRINITAISGLTPGDTLADLGALVLPAFRVEWEGGALSRPATIRFTLRDGARSSAEFLTSRRGDGPWERLGGTRDPSGTAVTAPLREPLDLAVVTPLGPVEAPAGDGGLSALAVTPRLLRTAAGQPASITFHLDAAARVDIRLYSPAGLLVRTIASGLELSAGDQVVAWDGRDEGGAWLADGPYIVVVDAGGPVSTQVVAVRR